jgi:serine carboxypeptidase 1
MRLLLSLAFVLLACACQAQVVPGQAWGYYGLPAKQNQTAMFWWLYGANNAARDTLPLVMWLQGGPGGSSLFGDFDEIGPLNATLGVRNTTWLNSVNLLFVDNPIGTGFSYTWNNQFSTTDQGIADNLVLFMQQFVQQFPALAKVPFYVFCESYGGKMTAYFGAALAKAIEAQTIALNFKGVALGDGWVDPLGCMKSYGGYLYDLSLINADQKAELDAYAKQAALALAEGNGTLSTTIWGKQQNKIEEFTGGVNVYNVLTYADYSANLQPLMDNTIKPQLGIIPANFTWGQQSSDVFAYMAGAFMMPGVAQVDFLLSKGYEVNVYSGQLDLIVDVRCTLDCIGQLTWPGLSSWKAASRSAVNINGVPNAYRQSFGNFTFWEIMRAGHMVPLDNGPMACRC